MSSLLAAFQPLLHDHNMGTCHGQTGHAAETQGASSSGPAPNGSNLTLKLQGLLPLGAGPGLAHCLTRCNPLLRRKSYQLRKLQLSSFDCCKPPRRGLPREPHVHKSTSPSMAGLMNFTNSWVCGLKGLLWLTWHMLWRML